jgi:ABC-type thiamin/hydroxymethylpyrimidine transport system permease subunit
MRKTLLIAGIVLIVFFVISLITGILCRVGYYGILDASPELYRSLGFHYKLNFILSGIFAAAAIVCFIIRAKTKT